MLCRTIVISNGKHAEKPVCILELPWVRYVNRTNFIIMWHNNNNKKKSILKTANPNLKLEQFNLSYKAASIADSKPATKFESFPGISYFAFIQKPLSTEIKLKIEIIRGPEVPESSQSEWMIHGAFFDDVTTTFMCIFNPEARRCASV